MEENVEYFYDFDIPNVPMSCVPKAKTEIAVIFLKVNTSVLHM